MHKWRFALALIFGLATAPISTKPVLAQSETQTDPLIRKRIPLPPRRPADLGPVAKPAVQPEPILKSPEIPSAPAPEPAAPRKQVVPGEVKTAPTLDQIDDALNQLTRFSASFSQIAGNGDHVNGRLAVDRPGRLRFDYNPPSPIRIIADGNAVAIIDTKLNTQDIYTIGLTPLKFLLRSQINLARDLSILGIRTDGGTIWVDAEDKATFGGTSRIAIGLDAHNLLLTQWTVTDPQGYEVRIVLSGIDTTTEIDPALFIIPATEKPASKK